MKLRTVIKREIDKQEAGKLFTARDVAPHGAGRMDTLKSLSLFYRNGLISKLTNGLYYKPRISSLNGAQLPPSFDAVIDKLKEVQGAAVWYVTGVAAYGNLMLTTQMSTVLEIATDRPRSPISFAGMTLKFVQSTIPVAVENPQLAQILDALKNIKKIPDASPETVCKRIAFIAKGLGPSELDTLVEYSQYYLPRVRALLGFCLDAAGQNETAQKVRDTLNPETTRYNIGLGNINISTSLSWNIQ